MWTRVPAAGSAAANATGRSLRRALSIHCIRRQCKLNSRKKRKRISVATYRSRCCHHRPIQNDNVLWKWATCCSVRSIPVLWNNYRNQPASHHKRTACCAGYKGDSVWACVYVRGTSAIITQLLAQRNARAADYFYPTARWHPPLRQSVEIEIFLAARKHMFNVI